MRVWELFYITKTAGDGVGKNKLVSTNIDIRGFNYMYIFVLIHTYMHTYVHIHHICLLYHRVSHLGYIPHQRVFPATVHCPVCVYSRGSPN